MEVKLWAFKLSNTGFCLASRIIDPTTQDQKELPFHIQDIHINTHGQMIRHGPWIPVWVTIQAKLWEILKKGPNKPMTANPTGSQQEPWLRAQEEVQPWGPGGHTTLPEVGTGLSRNSHIDLVERSCIATDLRLSIILKQPPNAKILDYLWRPWCKGLSPSPFWCQAFEAWHQFTLGLGNSKRLKLTEILASALKDLRAP